MSKYKAAVLLPLTCQGVNPVGVPLLEFDFDPQLQEGDLRTFGWDTGNKIIVFEALVTRCTVDESTQSINYMLEIGDRQLALDIAEIYRQNHPELFEENNFS